MSTAEAKRRLPVAAAAPLFAALGDKTRLQLLARLAHRGPASIKDLSSGARVSRQSITKHLVVLEHVGLVCSRRDGRERVCELAPGRLEEAHGYLDVISRQWDDALDRLKVFVE